MNKSISDLDQRQQAISPESSFIVQAPAGSGKTELLIQRYLKLLSLVEAPEEIVAITFTRKAATEMQNRIVYALECARLNVPAQDAVASLTGELAQSVLARDQQHDWQLGNNPGRLRIQTIDSLCAGLTRQMPILSKFGTQPETLEDAGELYLEAAANTLEELESGEAWSDDIAVLLAHLDNNLPRARDMLAGMLAKRDQWLRHVAQEIRREELEAALKHIVESTLAMVRKSFPEQDIHEFLECLRYATANLEREDNNSPIKICAGIDHLPGTTAMEVPRWQAIAEICLTKNNEWRKRLTADEGFPPASGNKAEKETRNTMKDRFQTLLARFAGETDLLDQLIEIRHLPPVAYTSNEWQVVEALCKLLKLADAQLRILFGERNQIDFTGVSAAAITALENDGTPTDLALYLDYQIKHLLVDEFQDVSSNQYTLLQQLTAGWAPGDGHTLFLVGDPMQSIYRFREAEVGLFLNTWQTRRLGQVPLTLLNITVNFRSQAGIVDWVNSTFSEVLPQIADPARGAVNFTAAIAFHQPSTQDAVTVYPFIDPDERNEADTLLELIEAARKQYQEGTIAILVRNRNHLVNIVPALRQAGLKFRAVEIEPLGQRPAIQDLLALTRALHHFADRIAWLAILRAPWCGLALGDLLLLTGDNKRTTIWECIQDEKQLQNLSRETQARLLKLRAVLNLHFANQRRRSLRRSVESVWISLGGPATLENETDLENARTYFELLEQFDSGGELQDREQFLEAVDKLYAAPDVHADGSLQIMTIHKAKGLEFDTVIVPGLQRKPKNDEPGLLLWTESPHSTRQDLLLAPIKEAGRDTSPIYKFLQRLEQERQQHEQARLLYVAATRAKHRLHLLGSVTTSVNGEMGRPGSGSLLSQLWPVVEPVFRAKFEQHQSGQTPRENPSPARINRLRRMTPDWILPVAPETVRWNNKLEQAEVPGNLPEYEWAGEAIRHAGTVTHRCIQKIAETGLDCWNESRIHAMRPHFEHALESLGVKTADLERASQSVEQALINMINDERGRWILQTGHADAHNEYRLSGLYAGRIINVIIDRTFVDAEGVRWIIDYKTGRHEGKDVDAFFDQEQQRYQSQLQKYGELIRGLDSRPVRLGLYFPLLTGWREFAAGKR